MVKKLSSAIAVMPLGSTDIVLAYIRLFSTRLASLKIFFFPLFFLRVVLTNMRPS